MAGFLRSKIVPATLRSSILQVINIYVCKFGASSLIFLFNVFMLISQAGIKNTHKHILYTNFHLITLYVTSHLFENTGILCVKVLTKSLY